MGGGGGGMTVDHDDEKTYACAAGGNFIYTTHFLGGKHPIFAGKKSFRSFCFVCQLLFLEEGRKLRPLERVSPPKSR